MFSESLIKSVLDELSLFRVSSLDHQQLFDSVESSAELSSTIVCLSLLLKHFESDTDSHSTVITEVSLKKLSVVTTRGSQHCITEGILLCGLTRLY